MKFLSFAYAFTCTLLVVLVQGDLQQIHSPARLRGVLRAQQQSDHPDGLFVLVKKHAHHTRMIQQETEDDSSSGSSSLDFEIPDTTDTINAILAQLDALIKKIADTTKVYQAAASKAQAEKKKLDQLTSTYTTLKKPVDTSKAKLDSLKVEQSTTTTAFTAQTAAVKKATDNAKKAKTAADKKKTAALLKTAQKTLLDLDTKLKSIKKAIDTETKNYAKALAALKPAETAKTASETNWKKLVNDQNSAEAAVQKAKDDEAALRGELASLSRENPVQVIQQAVDAAHQAVVDAFASYESIQHDLDAIFHNIASDASAVLQDETMTGLLHDTLQAQANYALKQFASGNVLSEATIKEKFKQALQLAIHQFYSASNPIIARLVERVRHAVVDALDGKARLGPSATVDQLLVVEQALADAIGGAVWDTMNEVDAAKPEPEDDGSADEKMQGLKDALYAATSSYITSATAPSDAAFADLVNQAISSALGENNANPQDPVQQQAVASIKAAFLVARQANAQKTKTLDAIQTAYKSAISSAVEAARDASNAAQKQAERQVVFDALWQDAYGLMYLAIRPSNSDIVQSLTNTAQSVLHLNDGGSSGNMDNPVEVLAQMILPVVKQAYTSASSNPDAIQTILATVQTSLESIVDQFKTMVNDANSQSDANIRNTVAEALQDAASAIRSEENRPSDADVANSLMTTLLDTIKSFENNGGSSDNEGNDNHNDGTGDDASNAILTTLVGAVQQAIANADAAVLDGVETEQDIEASMNAAITQAVDVAKAAIDANQNAKLSALLQSIDTGVYSTIQQLLGMATFPSDADTLNAIRSTIQTVFSQQGSGQSTDNASSQSGSADDSSFD